MRGQSSRKKVLVLCHDTIGKKMAGPGIRYQNVADQIERVADVTLAMFSDEDKTPEPELIYVEKSGQAYKKIFDQHDVIFAQWLSGEMLDYAHTSGKTVVFDLYAPVPIEYLASLGFSNAKIGSEKDLEFSGILETYKTYLDKGDFFVCSNERQRDFWVGFITSSNLIHPTSFKQSNTLLDKISIGPMGISSKEPSSKDLQLRKKLGLKKDDFVMLWTGGIWDWFDAQVIIRAVHQLKNDRVKLVFLGTKHPNTAYKDEMSESVSARNLSENLKLTNKSVFFLDGWVPYSERTDYFLDADIAIYADKESLETRFSHRTRVLDHIWTNLPTLCTKGDYMAEVIEDNGFGVVVAQRNPEAFVKAIQELLLSPKKIEDIKKNITKNKARFTWESSLDPLVRFIESAPVKDTAKIIQPPRTSKPRIRNRVKRAVKVLVKG